MLSLLLDIAQAASTAKTAQRYIDAIVDHCEALSTFPKRRVRRDDIRPGLRLTNYRGRTVVAFNVNDVTATVLVLGVSYRGQKYEKDLTLDLDQPAL